MLRESYNSCFVGPWAPSYTSWRASFMLNGEKIILFCGLFDELEITLNNWLVSSSLDIWPLRVAMNILKIKLKYLILLEENKNNKFLLTRNLI